MRTSVALSLLPFLAAASPVFNVGTIRHEAAPVLTSVHSKEIPDSYIVVFKDHVTDTGASVHHNWVQDIHADVENEKNELRKRSEIPFITNTFAGLKHTYNIAGGFLGYSGHFDESVIDQIRRHPDVSYHGMFYELDCEANMLRLGRLC